MFWINHPPGVYSQVIYIARIRHLLDVDAERPVSACVKLDDAVFNHVLQVGEASPDVPLVLHGVCSGAGVPVPEGGCRGGYWLKKCDHKMIHSVIVDHLSRSGADPSSQWARGEVPVQVQAQFITPRGQFRVTD